jgi:hypothetical protein
MLFAVKNRLGLTLLVAALLALTAWGLKETLGLEWRVEPQFTLLVPGLLGAAAIAVSDGVLQGIVWLLWGIRYGRSYRALVEYFRPQGAWLILAGGVLAAVEELVFRGVLVEGLRSRAGFAAVPAVGVAAVAFGLCHLVPRRPLIPFALWAVWEGALLGGVYVLCDSLLVGCVVHALHDVVGFSLFAYQRRTGWLLAKEADPLVA